MKGVYLTEESRQDIQNKIIELEQKQKVVIDDFDEFNSISTKKSVYKEILESATILPVEESYNSMQHFETLENGTVIRKHFLMANYPQGVIIQPKQQIK